MSAVWYLKIKSGIQVGILFISPAIKPPIVQQVLFFYLVALENGKQVQLVRKFMWQH
jgi:hypothetical protein